MVAVVLGLILLGVAVVLLRKASSTPPRDTGSTPGSAAASGAADREWGAAPRGSVNRNEGSQGEWQPGQVLPAEHAPAHEAQSGAARSAQLPDEQRDAGHPEGTQLAFQTQQAFQSQQTPQQKPQQTPQQKPQQAQPDQPGSAGGTSADLASHPEPSEGPAVDNDAARGGVGKEAGGFRGVEAREESSQLFNSVRRRRRNWAAQHGFEYIKEDEELPAQWPEFLLLAGLGNQDSTRDAERLVVRDVVSGFYEGHSTHIGDVGASTYMAMRRDALSPVTVHYTQSEAMPEGLRRSEALDQSPFVAYTSDIRALDRMLDARVEDGLMALSNIVRDAVWDTAWVLLRFSRKLDQALWQEMLPYARQLADAAMVLPPAQLTVPLDMDQADQTRAMPGGVLSVKTSVTDSQEEDAAAGCGNQDAPDGKAVKSTGGHIRALPDPARDSVGDQSAEHTISAGASGAEGAEARAEGAAGTSGNTGSSAGSSNGSGAGIDPNGAGAPERPEVTRPAEPVVFPSRSSGRTEGNPEDFKEFHVADELRGEGQDEGVLPRLGEDPEHISPSAAQRAQVIRTDGDREATIFADYDGPGSEEPEYEEPDYEEPNYEDAYADPADFATNFSRIGADSAAVGDYEDEDEGDDADSMTSNTILFAASERQPDEPAARQDDLSHTSRMRRSERTSGRGRHRAPDARHARPEPLEAVEMDIETVDGEVVEE